MKLLVCIKQVPEPEHITVEGGDDGCAVMGEFTQFRMNRFDEFALEEALRLKEVLVEVRIDALTVGPERSLEVVKRAIGMGADHGVHLTTPAGVDGEPAGVSAWISHYARRRNYDLILTGSMSEDGMNGQVGPMTAAYLNLPCVTQVIRMRVSADRSALTIEKEVEGGAREMLELTLPAVLALQSGINRPRYPSLSNLLRANRQAVESVDVTSLESPGPSVARLGTVVPRRRRSVSFLEGTPLEKAEQFLALLREKAFIR